MTKAKLTPAEVAALRPMIHSHMTMLSAAGTPPEKALAIAAQCAALCYSELLEEALNGAYHALELEYVGE